MDCEISSSWKIRSSSLLDYLEEDQDPVVPMQVIQEPEMPREPMEFLSRSWSLSASEISKALAQRRKQLRGGEIPTTLPDAAIEPQLTGKTVNSVHLSRTGGMGKWFHHHKEFSNTGKKKDQVRMENAHIHSALSVAGLATALAAVAAAGSSSCCSLKMGVALASATELLASYCLELAESAGADHDRVASVVRSAAVGIQSPGDLMTLTAAAATALRGEAALKSRLPKEAKKNASISPYDKGMADELIGSSHVARIEEQSPPCAGELLQHTTKGAPQWKHVSVYVNKKSQVIMKIKSKHVGGAFSKKHKCIVYGLCDEIAAWPYKKERESSEEVYFGVKTAQGLMEFKCKSKNHKQKWVDGVQQLLRRVSVVDTAEESLKTMNNGI